MSYLVEMLIGGMPVKKINYNGKTYLPVSFGDDFQIKISNNTHKRICAVVSVDGLSVMNGKSASHNDNGYIVEPYDNTIINGWRRGDYEVAKFGLSHSGDAYASKRGKPDNIGVIGVAIYPEKQYKPIKITDKAPIPFYPSPRSPWPKPNSPKWSEPNYNCNVITRNCTQPIGTKYGDKIADHVTHVQFKRDVNAKAVIVLYYNTVEELRNCGVPVDQYIGVPNPFPAENNQFYCPEP